MITQQVCLDWVTLTSYSRDAARAFGDGLHERLRLKDEKPKPGKTMQYEGNTWVASGVFMGTALQNGRQHYMLRVSGESASACAEQFALAGRRSDSSELNATRLDVQLTLKSVAQGAPEVQAMYRSMTEALRQGARGANPYGSRVTLIEGDDGECTLYLGSRTSERYIRVYQKPGSDGFAYTRLEVECKGSVARALAASLMSGTNEGQSAMNTVISRAVELFGSVTALASHRQFVASLALGTAPTGARTVSELSNTVAWLRNAVFPAVKRLSKDGDYREETLQILLEMLRCFTEDDAEPKFGGKG